MFEIPFLEKINIIFNLVKSSKTFFGLIIFSFVFMVLLFAFKKRRKLIFTIFTLTFVGSLLFINSSQLGKFFDYFVEVLMNLLYFPNFCLYTVLFVSLNIVMIYAINSKKILEYNRKIVIGIYLVVCILFAFTINTIGNININLNDKLSIYSNKIVLSLIETTTLIITLLYAYLFIGFILKRILYTKNENELQKTIKMQRVLLDNTSNVKMTEKYEKNMTRTFNKFIENVNSNSLTLNEIKTTDFEVSSNALIDLYSKL